MTKIMTKTSEQLTQFDAAKLLETDEMISTFMNEAFKTGDATYIAHAIGTAARAKSMIQVARESGLCREQLYRSFSKQGNPTLRSLLAVLDALGLTLTVKSKVLQQIA